MNIFCFGDSFGAGSGLKYFEKPFVHWFSIFFHSSYTNFSVPGNSLGVILHEIVNQKKNIKKDDIVLVVVPPDTRWYDENQDKGFFSVMNWMPEYRRNLGEKTLEWFIYHNALFIYTAQKILDEVGCQYIMIFAYGNNDDREKLRKYNLSIDYEKFYHKTISDIIGNVDLEWPVFPDHLPLTHQFNVDAPNPIKEKPYPTSKYHVSDSDHHPNELGHKLIAQKLYEKYCELY